MKLDPRTPILVGVGTCADDVEPVELMCRSTEAAARDAGTASLLAAVGEISIPRGTWAYPDPGRIVRDRIGAADARSVLVEVGIPQQTLIDDAMLAMMRGDLDVAVIVGAEAKARAARIKGSSTKADVHSAASVFLGKGTAEGVALETDQGDVRPDETRVFEGEIIDQAELAAALWTPVEQYALIESALGAREGRTVVEHRREIDELYERCNEVAVQNPDAAFGSPMSADSLGTFSAGHRPIAFPYGKWHVTQWTVDQSAALLLCTVEAAERHGVPRDRWVFPLVGLGSSNMVPVSQRADIGTWPAMRVLGEAAASHLGFPLSACSLVELYSCFPVAVRLQQRELGLDLGGTPTITGGMAFGGGPFNSFVLQSIAAMVPRLRTEGGRGLVTSVSGFLTKPGLGVWSTETDGRLPLVADLGDTVAAETTRVPVVAEHVGEAVVAAATVTYEGMDPAVLVAILDTPDGSRVIARSSNPQLLEDATTGSGLVGKPLTVDGNSIVIDP